MFCLSKIRREWRLDLSKLRKLLSFMPITAVMRGKLYRAVCRRNGSSIGKNFRIGFGSYIDSEIIDIGNNVSLGNMVRIKLLDKFALDDESSIGSSTIICGAYEFNKFLSRNFICGKKVDILSSHYFDVVAPITIGDNVTIAGKWTQFYTHSFDLVPNRFDGAVTIGNNVYIGAGCLVNLGVQICDGVVLQGGTCVNKSINEPGVYTSNTFFKRGQVREYSEMFATGVSKELSTGIKVYLKE